jgi:exopolysaccharide production protein ExoZ
MRADSHSRGQSQPHLVGQPQPTRGADARLAMTSHSNRRLFPWVQGLRAIAALAVAFLHIANDATSAGRDTNGLLAAVSHLLPWISGVDIFFVISGFVIVHASAELFAQPGGGMRFLRRRLTRIVPLYWTLTTLFLATVLLQPSAVRGEMGGAGYILASYLFFPWPRPDGLMEPALGLGWTLNHEMFFYLVLTPFLLLPRTRAVLGSAAALCLLVAVGQVFGFGAVFVRFWADPIILEFILGMGIALAVANGLTLPGWFRLALVAAAVVCLHVQAEGAFAWRVVSFGLPGALLVVAAVSGRRPEHKGSAMRGMIRLGAASYAMYLFHPFVMRGFTLLVTRVGADTAASGIVTVVLSLTVAQLCALAIDAGFQLKLTGMLRRTTGSKLRTPGRDQRNSSRHSSRPSRHDIVTLGIRHDPDS